LRTSSPAQWRLVFAATSLAEVADEFNRYNHRQLVISDPAVAAIRISGTFKPRM